MFRLNYSTFASKALETQLKSNDLITKSFVFNQDEGNTLVFIIMNLASLPIHAMFSFDNEISIEEIFEHVEHYKIAYNQLNEFTTAEHLFLQHLIAKWILNYEDENLDATYTLTSIISRLEKKFDNNYEIAKRLCEDKIFLELENKFSKRVF